MSLASEPTQTPSSQNSPAEPADQVWLQSLNFRRSAPETLREAARAGDLQGFAKALPAAFDEQCHIGKREKFRLLGTLATLWNHGDLIGESQVQAGSLAHCLFDRELNRDELSGRVEAIMASSAEGKPDRATLVAAHWLLRMAASRLEPQTLLAFYRWTQESSQSWLNETQWTEPDQISPKSGCDAFDRLEILTLSSLCSIGQKGSRKLTRQTARAWRVALDAITDSDGTPHSRWLNEIFNRTSQLAAVSLFSDSLNAELWDRKSHKRLEELFARTASLVSPDQVLVPKINFGPACSLLLAIAEILHLKSNKNLLSLLAEWEDRSIKPRLVNQKNAKLGKLPMANHQSDWAEWASLRSAWPNPVDQCLVRFDGEMPRIDVLAAGTPLFSGLWSHELKVNGEDIPASWNWSCSCWYLDRQAAFIELQLSGDSPVQLFRQALLLRTESVLIIADSIRLPETGQIDYRRMLPFAGNWSCEEDSLSRELALIQGESRIRVFPWTGPQMRLHASHESTSVTKEGLQLHSQVQANGLYSATVMDWSESRRESPIDWQRITVAEDGKLMPPEVAAGHRLRIGKKQWMVYHSLQKPAIPRSTLGLHTLSETVYGQVKSNGDVGIFMEVEL